MAAGTNPHPNPNPNQELLPGGDLYTQVVERYGRQGGSSNPTPNPNPKPNPKPNPNPSPNPNPNPNPSRQDGYSEHDVRSIMRMALQGLAAIHEHNVIHRHVSK